MTVLVLVLVLVRDAEAAVRGAEAAVRVRVVAVVRGAEAAVLAARIGSSQESPHHRSGSSRLRGYCTPRAIRRLPLPLRGCRAHAANAKQVSARYHPSTQRPHTNQMHPFPFP